MTYAATAGLLRDRLWISAPVGACAWVVWLSSLAIGGWKYDSEGTLVGIDHMAFYSVANLILNDRAAQMYDYEFLGSYQGCLIGRDWGMLVGYRNPPFFALLYLPTASLPFVASYLVWSAIGFALLAGSILLLRPARPGRTLLLALSFYPVFAAVSFGQNTLLSLAIFAAIYHFLDSERPFAAGMTAGLLWFKPQLLLGLLVWWTLAPKRYARAWVGVTITGAALAALSWIALPDASRAFVDSLGRNVGYGGENGWNKESPRAFWALLLPDARPIVAWSLAVASAVAGIAAFVWVARRNGFAVDTSFPACVFLTLWISPHTLIYEWALLVPAAILLWERRAYQRDAWLCLFVTAWVVLAATTPIAMLQIRYLHLHAIVQMAIPIMGAVGALGFRELARSAVIPSLSEPLGSIPERLSGYPRERPLTQSNGCDG